MSIFILAVGESSNLVLKLNKYVEITVVIVIPL